MVGEEELIHKKYWIGPFVITNGLMHAPQFLTPTLIKTNLDQHSLLLNFDCIDYIFAFQFRFIQM